MSKKQHVSVAARIRPLLQEQLRKEQECLSLENNKITISLVHKLKHFDLPVVFDKSSSQQAVFQSCLLPLTQNLFQGFNCAFLCCGQNKSGKSYTLEGGNSEESKGMISRLVDFLSLKLGSQQKQSTYIMRMSYIQIYQEQIIDLLGIRKRVSPEIVQRGRQIELKGVQLKHIHKIREIENFWIIGNRKRHLAYSKKYRNPHKSTSIFTLYLQSLSENEGVQEVRRGKLHIVDMAASKIDLPVLISSPLKREEQYNLSLNALKNVSHALVYSKNTVNVPYKDSKVTLLLRQNLGGLGRTCILFHLIPTSSKYSSSLDSLRLGRVLMQIQNQVYCQVHSTRSTILARIQQLQECMCKLQQIEREISQKKQQQIKSIDKQEDQNQFLSQSYLQQRQKDLKNNMQELLSQKIKLKKNIENIQSLFLKEDFSEEKQIQFRTQYKDLLSKRNQEMAKLAQSHGSSRGFNANESYQTNGFKDKNRNHFQELFDLQTQFQEERYLLLQKIRKLEGQFKFYEKVSLQTVKKQEIDILRGSSRYDSTKRSYEVPDFAVRQKKISFAEKMFESRKTLSERKFIMIKSFSERQASLRKRRQQICENLEEIKKESLRQVQEKIRKSNRGKAKERKQKLNTQYFPEHMPAQQGSLQQNRTNVSRFKERKKGGSVSKSLTRLRFK